MLRDVIVDSLFSVLVSLGQLFLLYPYKTCERCNILMVSALNSESSSLQGSYRSWKTWKVMEFVISISWPGKSVKVMGKQYAWQTDVLKIEKNNRVRSRL